MDFSSITTSTNSISSSSIFSMYFTKNGKYSNITKIHLLLKYSIPLGFIINLCIIFNFQSNKLSLSLSLTDYHTLSGFLFSKCDHWPDVLWGEYVFLLGTLSFLKVLSFVLFKGKRSSSRKIRWPDVCPNDASTHDAATHGTDIQTIAHNPRKLSR